MEKKFKQQLEKAKHLQLARKKEVYSNDYQMVTFTAHLEEMSEIRAKLIAEIDNYTEEVERLTTDIKQCIDILQQRQKELNQEHELVDNIRPNINNQ